MTILRPLFVHRSDRRARSGGPLRSPSGARLSPAPPSARAWGGGSGAVGGRIGRRGRGRRGGAGRRRPRRGGGGRRGGRRGPIAPTPGAAAGRPPARPSSPTGR